MVVSAALQSWRNNNMYEVFDIQDASFLKKYEDVLMAANTPAQQYFNAGFKLANVMPQYHFDNQEVLKDIFSHYNHIYPGWTRFLKENYVFRFSPDKPTLAPHVDIDPNTYSLITGKLKRVLIYANHEWDTSWGGGTYFAPFEKYGVNRHYAGRVSRKKFAQEADLVENRPGRIVVFDPSEIHMPQEFSGNTVPRLVMAGAFCIPEHDYLFNYVVNPSNSNGNGVATWSTDWSAP